MPPGDADEFEEFRGLVSEAAKKWTSIEEQVERKYTGVHMVDVSKFDGGDTTEVYNKCHRFLQGLSLACVCCSFDS